MGNTAKKKQTIFIIGLLVIFAGMIGALCAISANSTSAYADSSNGIVENNYLLYNDITSLGNSTWNGNVGNNGEDIIYRKGGNGNGELNGNVLTFTGTTGTAGQWAGIGFKIQDLQSNTEYTYSTKVDTIYSGFCLIQLWGITTNNQTISIISSGNINTTGIKTLTFNSSNYVYIYCLIQVYGRTRFQWVKAEKGSSFTGYVKDTYINYGYEQGKNNAYFETDKHVSYVNNPTMEIDYYSTQSKTSSVAQQATSSVYENNFIPYWFVQSQNTNIYAQRTNTNGKIVNAVNIYPNTTISSVYRTTGVKGVNPIGSITEGKKYLITTIADDGLFTNIFCMNDNQTDDFYDWEETSAYFTNVLQKDPNLPGYNQPIYQYTEVYNGIRITSTYEEIKNVGTTNAFLYEIYYPALSGNTKKLYYFNVTEATEFTGIEKNPYGAFMWQQVKDNLYNQGYTDGYALGYDTGTEDNTNYMQNVVDQAYENGKQLGRDQGWIKGFDTGHEQGYAEGQAIGIRIGKQQGYEDGLNDAGTNNFGSLLSAVFNTPLTILFGNINSQGIRVGGLLNWELPLGGQTINLMGLATALLSILLLGAVIKLVIKLVA